jgi:hypothetical protein
MPWTRSAARSGTRALSPPDQILRASLLVIASVTSKPRSGRDNPRHAKRSHRYPAKAADPAKRKRPRGPFTLVMLPLPASEPGAGRSLN